MLKKELMYKLLNKCNIFFNEALISKEQLIHAYSEFLIANFVNKDKAAILTLHTGSKCFDIVSILVGALGTLFLDTVNVDDILDSLCIGDMVLYKNERYLWGGFACRSKVDFISVEEISKATYFLLEQKKLDKNIGKIISKSFFPLANKNLISPYYGSSKTTDGRGIRKKKDVRTDFISTVFETPISEIKEISGVSTVMVFEREYAESLINGITIEFGNQKKCCLLDIVTASYFTEGDEYPLRGNVGKNDPVIKLTSKVSIARDMIFDKTGNYVVSLLVHNSESIANGESELPELISNKSLKFVSLCVDMDSYNLQEIVSGFEITEYFACTNRFLQAYNTKRVSNQVTDELFLQVENILHKDIVKKILPGSCTSEQYKKAKEALLLIKRHEYENIDKQDFLIEAYSLINLFSTAVFPFAKLSDMLKESSNTKTITPNEKLKKLWEIAYKLPASLENNAIIVLELLEIFLKQLVPLKYLELKKLLYYSNNKRIALIVPKVYYKDVLLNDRGLLLNNVTITTANKFNNSTKYDEIVVVGNFSGKHFDVFRNISAPRITVLLYEYETDFFCNRQKYFENIQSEINNLIFSDSYEGGETDKHISKEIELFEKSTIEIEEYVENIRSLNFLHYATSFTSHIASATGEVIAVGTFITGEKILFSKFYKAFVFNKVKGTVIETDVEKLSSGDTLVFTKRNNFTKNIVDDIFDNLIMGKKVTDQMLDAEFKAKYWKLLLQEYKDKNNLTFKELSLRLSELGCKRHELTIKTWLERDYGIIGPNDKEAFVQIAKLTGDKDMVSDPQSFYEACKDVRQTRRKILSLIGQAIMDIYSGKKESQDQMLNSVYENVEKVAFTLEIESITKLEEHCNISVNLMNKPIAEEE